MEASSSQPQGSDRPFNPSTGAGTGDRVNHAGRDADNLKSYTAPKIEDNPELSLDELRRWEDARIGELGDGMTAVGAALEGQREEMRQVFRNELMMAIALLVLGGMVAGMAKEILKLKELTSAITTE